VGDAAWRWPPGGNEQGAVAGMKAHRGIARGTMDSNEGRRSKVPAGTFRSSNRPPQAPAAGDAPAHAPAVPPPPPAASARPPKPPVPSAAPTRRVGTNSADPPKLAPPDEIDGRSKFTSTLVGVSPSKAPAPPAASSPVLAPPPWRGASAYEGGQEPQPRVSSISSPGIAPGVNPDGTVAHPDDRRVPHTRITAAAPPAPVADAEEPPSPATAAIGDAIQQLLDAQTSVSMEGVQEAAPHVSSGTLRGQPAGEFLGESEAEPVRESQIEMVSDSSIEEEVAPPESVRSLPPAAPVATRSAEPTLRTHVEPSAVPEPRQAPPSARWSAPPAPVVARAGAAAPEFSDSELAAYSFVEREPDRDASFGPAEVGNQAASADDSNVRLGTWVAAAIVLVGFGGWLVTRGGFDIPPRTPVATPVIAAPPPAEPVVPAVAPAASPELGDVAPAPSATAAPAAPAAASEPTPAAAVSRSEPRAPIAARPPRPPLLNPLATADEPAADPVMTVTPVAPEAPVPAAEPAVPAGPLPETPTRENVQSALDAKRSEVLVCAAGQHGIAEVDLTVSSTGAVTHAVVAGDFAGSPAGSCIARVVRTARFAPFSKPRFRVIYPFSL
jgi:hypothetical protein